MSHQFQSTSLSRGDKVQQIAPLGLAVLQGFFFVWEADKGEIEIAKEVEGPPLTDLYGLPRHYPARAVRKVTWES